MRQELLLEPTQPQAPQPRSALLLPWQKPRVPTVGYISPCGLCSESAEQNPVVPLHVFSAESGAVMEWLRCNRPNTQQAQSPAPRTGA